MVRVFESLTEPCPCEGPDIMSRTNRDIHHCRDLFHGEAAEKTQLHQTGGIRIYCSKTINCFVNVEDLFVRCWSSNGHEIHRGAINEAAATF